MSVRTYLSELPLSPELAAEVFRERTGFYGPPLDVNRLLAKLEDCERLDVDIDASGYLVPAGILGKSNIIVVAKSASRQRARFTVAHELGHLALLVSPVFLEGPDEEMWCDSFATALLMPRSHVLAFAEQARELEDWISFRSRFAVSLSAAARRVWECCRVALVVHNPKKPAENEKFAQPFAELLTTGQLLETPGDHHGVSSSGAPYLIRRDERGQFVGIADCRLKT